MHVRIFDRRIFVALSQDTSIARGTEVTSINGASSTDIIKRLSRYATVDGYTDFARTTLLADDAAAGHRHGRQQTSGLPLHRHCWGARVAPTEGVPDTR